MNGHARIRSTSRLAAWARHLVHEAATAPSIPNARLFRTQVV